jgi:hypothetical protein
MISCFFLEKNILHGKHSKIDFINSVVVVILTAVLVIVGYNYFGVVGVATATSFGMMLINIVKVIEVRVFYKIFPYEIKNIALMLIVFCSFYLIRMINLNIQNLITRLFVNFSLSLLIAFLSVLSVYAFRRKKYNYKNLLLVFSDFKR